MKRSFKAAFIAVPLVAVFAAFVTASPQPPPASAPAAAPVVTPAQTASDPRSRSNLPMNSEPMPAKLLGGVEIPMTYGMPLSASPTDPFADPLKQTDWVYVPRFYFETVKYDPKTRRLRGTLSNVANALTLERMQDVIRQRTGRPAGSTVNLDAAPINAVVIEMVFEGKTNELFRLQSGFEVPRGSIPINVAVTDELLRTELAENLENVLFTARTLVPRVSVDHARMDLSVSFETARSVLETLMPKADFEKVMAGQPLLIDRSEAAILKSLLRENFIARIRGNDKKLAAFQATFDRLLDSMFVATQPIYDISKDDLSSALKYDAATKKLAPDDWKRDALTAWETWNKHWTSVQSSWDIIKSEAKEAKSHEEFKSRVETKAKTGLDFGAAFKGIPFKLGFKTSTSGTGATEGSSDDWAKAWEYARNSGSLDQRAYDENSSKGVGNFQNSTTFPRILRLSRVVGIDSQSIRSFLMLREEEVSKGLFEDSYAVKAVNGTTVQDDCLTQIARLRQDMTRELAARDATITALKAELTASIAAERKVATDHADTRHTQSVAHADKVGVEAKTLAEVINANIRKDMKEQIGRFRSHGMNLELDNGIYFRIHPDGTPAIVDTVNRRVRWFGLGEWKQQ